jgi:hydrogenase expression/formation protein HypE
VTILRPARQVRDTRITLAHGSGGKAMHDLIEDVFVATFDNAARDPLEDQARLPLLELMAHGDRLAFTTDSYVVDPLFFAGGDIGRLAVAGTVNDLAVGGAKPLYLSCAVIAEEGLDIALLRRVARSMQDTAAEASVKLVTGDTKVVPRGTADKLFINTAGIGGIPEGVSIAADRAQRGDVILSTARSATMASPFCRSARISASQPRSPAIASR